MSDPSPEKSFLVQRFAKIPLGNPLGSLHEPREEFQRVATPGVHSEDGKT